MSRLSETYTDFCVKTVDFSPDCLSLADVLKRNRDQFPIVIRSINSLPLPGRPSLAGSFPQGVVVVVEKVVTMEFVHFKILRYNDDAKMSSKYGGEFVLDHNNFIDVEFLIPKDFPRKLTLQPRPGRRLRYVSARQIAEESPNIVRVGQPTQCDGLLGHFRTIPENTELQVTGISQKHLKCRDPLGNQVSFNLDTHLNCTYVHDSHHYTLEEIIRFPLPKVAIFDDIYEVKNAVMSRNSNDESRTVLTGPIEILGTKQMQVALCWSRDQTLKTFPTLLMPSGSWGLEIYVADFPSPEQKRRYLETLFGPCTDLTFVKDSLYLLPTRDDFVTTLFHPDLDMFPFIEYDDDETDSNYEDVKEIITPPPTPPPRMKCMKQSSPSIKPDPHNVTPDPSELVISAEEQSTVPSVDLDNNTATSEPKLDDDNQIAQLPTFEEASSLACYEPLTENTDKKYDSLFEETGLEETENNKPGDDGSDDEYEYPADVDNWIKIE